MLQKLKEFKEIITIILFFTGGFTWLNSQFPTKNDLSTEIGSLNCLLDKYMTLTQLQYRGQVLEKRTLELAKMIAMAPPADNEDAILPLTPAMKFKLDQLKAEFNGGRKDLRDNVSDMEKIQDDLARNICRKE